MKKITQQELSARHTNVTDDTGEIYAMPVNGSHAYICRCGAPLTLYPICDIGHCATCGRWYIYNYYLGYKTNDPYEIVATRATLGALEAWRIISGVYYWSQFDHADDAEVQAFADAIKWRPLPVRQVYDYD